MKAAKSERRYAPPFVSLICLLFFMYNPIHGESRKEIRTANDDLESVQTDPDSTSSPIPNSRLSSEFTLTQFIAKTPYTFEIKTCRMVEPRLEHQAQILSPSTSKPSLEQTLYASSLATLTALSIADVATTVKALKLDGLREGNPVMRPIVKNIYLFSAVKLGVAVMDYILLKKLHRKNKKWGWVASLAANLAMSYVVANNIRRIQEVREQ